MTWPLRAEKTLLNVLLVITPPSSLLDGAENVIQGGVITQLWLSVGDDAIAVHGQYAMVATINKASNSITVAVWNCYDVSCLFIQPGDIVLLYSPRVQNLGYATVTATANANQPPGVSGPSNNAPQVSSYLDRAFVPAKHYYFLPSLHLE